MRIMLFFALAQVWLLQVLVTAGIVPRGVLRFKDSRQDRKGRRRDGAVNRVSCRMMSGF